MGKGWEDLHVGAFPFWCLVFCERVVEQDGEVVNGAYLGIV